MIESPALSTSPATGWRSWGVEKWGERLLEHFFGRQLGRDQSDVRVIVASAETLAVLVGEPVSNAATVRDHFVDTVVTASMEVGGLLEHAVLGWSPEAPDCVPPVLAHLYVTCLAASEDADSDHGEDEFIGPLERVCRGNVGSLENLPKLWERLGEWLLRGSNRRRYRGLVLPDPAAWRRVGYSYRLAFPCRHDRKELCAVLADAGLNYPGAPVARVVAAVAAQRRRFRHGLQEALDEFRALWDADRANPDLSEHRFWSAVQNAVLESEVVGACTAKSAISAVGFEIEDSIALLIGSRQPFTVPSPFLCEPLSYPIGELGYGIAVNDCGDFNRYELATQLAIAGTGAPWLPARLRQGVLIFKDGNAGYFDLVERDELTTAVIALVRDDLAIEFVSRFGTHRTRRFPARLPGWSEVRQFAAGTLDSAVLDTSPLRDCSILHESVYYPRIRLAGGVRCDDGYLGLLDHLPQVRIEGADNVTLVQDDVPIHLRRRTESLWSFPERNFSGPGMLVAARQDHVVDQRSIVFLSAPATERPRRPSTPGDWFTEGLHGATIFVEESKTDQAVQDLGDVVRTTALLGPDVGEFTQDVRSAAWLVTVTGRQKNLRRNLTGEVASTPHHQSTDSGLARKWRKWVFNSTADPATEAERRMIRRSATSPLPPREMTVGWPDLEYSPVTASEDQKLDELTSVLAGRSSTRAGIPFYEWQSYLQMLGGLAPQSSLEAVSRGWEESGIIDLLWHARWRTVTAFVRPPLFLVYADSEYYHATLSGLALRGTRDALMEEAPRRGLSATMLGAVSRLVPATVRVSARSEAAIREFAARFDIRVQTLDANLRQFASQRNLDTGSPPISGYGAGNVVEKWSVAATPSPTVVVRHFARNDRPDVWVIERGEERWWSYSRNSARLIACAVGHIGPLKERGGNEILAAGAFLPLPLARILAAVTAARSGPTENSTYLYSVPTLRLRDELMAVTQQPPHP